MATRYMVMAATLMVTAAACGEGSGSVGEESASRTSSLTATVAAPDASNTEVAKI
jgi:hypothetical protein